MLFNLIFSLLPLKEKRVLFLSDVRAGFGGSLKSVCEKVPAGFEIKTSFKADRRVKRSFGEYMRLCVYLATSKYIFLDDFAQCTSYMRVRKNQQLVQLWHGSGAYKKFGHSRAQAGEPVRIHPGYKRYTLAVTSSEAVRECYAQAFSLPLEKTAALGNPATDAFFDKEYRQRKIYELFKRFPEFKGKKIILFAPTYRGGRVEDASYDFDRLNLKELRGALADEYVFIIKWHPALYNNLRSGRVKGPDISVYSGFAYDLSSFREVNDLLFAADVLVTDYSSVIFDYALLDKPIIYFTYDLEEYEGKRGLYFPFEEYIYGEVVRESSALANAIKRGKMHEEKRAAFKEKFILANDGGASVRVVNAVFGKQA